MLIQSEINFIIYNNLYCSLFAKKINNQWTSYLILCSYCELYFLTILYHYLLTKPQHYFYIFLAKMLPIHLLVRAFKQIG